MQNRCPCGEEGLRLCRNKFFSSLFWEMEYPVAGADVAGNKGKPGRNSLMMTMRWPMTKKRVDEYCSSGRYLLGVPVAGSF